jgi:hypothetical protein
VFVCAFVFITNFRSLTHALRRFEPVDAAIVSTELNSEACACGDKPCLAVQPRITELVAFFLSVFSHADMDMACTSSTEAMSDDDLDGHGFFGAMDMENHLPNNNNISPPLTRAGTIPMTKSPFAVSPMKTPQRPTVVLDPEEFDLRWRSRMPRMSVEVLPDELGNWLSSRTTPNTNTATPNSNQEGALHSLNMCSASNTSPHKCFFPPCILLFIFCCSEAHITYAVFFAVSQTSSQQFYNSFTRQYYSLLL